MGPDPISKILLMSVLFGMAHLDYVVKFFDRFSLGIQFGGVWRQ
jgi:hypothetical protein